MRERGGRETKRREREVEIEREREIEREVTENVMFEM